MSISAPPTSLIPLGVACLFLRQQLWKNSTAVCKMFEDSFQPLHLNTSQPPESKQLSKRPRSPPKSCEEWLRSQEQGTTNCRTPAASSWPKRAPQGEQLLEEPVLNDGANLIFGTLENIKADIQRHARKSSDK